MYLSKSSYLIKKYYQKLLWEIPNAENKIYLTFDDGPTPEVTEWTLKTLKQYNIKATFFCIGNNIEKHPNIFEQIKKEGHQVANHTQEHNNGWKTKNEAYYDSINKCQQLTQTNLFRPPYGRIRKSQASKLVQDYKIVMWSVLSGDFDPKTAPEKCLKNVTKHTQSGSIIVFHDSVKAFDKLQYALPKAIEYLLAKGFVFDVIR